MIILVKFGINKHFKRLKLLFPFELFTRALVMPNNYHIKTHQIDFLINLRQCRKWKFRTKCLFHVFERKIFELNCIYREGRGAVFGLQSFSSPLCSSSHLLPGLKVKVCIRAKWSIRPELNPVSVA